MTIKAENQPPGGLPPLPKGGSVTAPPKQPPPPANQVVGKPYHIVLLCFMVSGGVALIMGTAFAIWSGGYWGIAGTAVVAACGFVLGHSTGVTRGLKVMAERRVSLDPETWGQ